VTAKLLQPMFGVLERTHDGDVIRLHSTTPHETNSTSSPRTVPSPHGDHRGRTHPRVGISMSTPGDFR
jgi:hypothetical protein